MQKQENFLLEGLRSKKDVLFWVQNIKVPLGIGHPPIYTSNLVYMCAGGLRGHKSSNRIELSQFIQYLLQFFWFGFPQLLGGGAGGWGISGWPTIVYISWGVFRGKESSNRIEISRLVQDLLNFGVLGSLWLWGVGGWGCGVVGGALHTCAHAHTHTHTRTCTYTC